jgi:hypothetical protein
MMNNRRSFIKNTAFATLGMSVIGRNMMATQSGLNVSPGKRVGMIGLDTSHCPAFTRALNAPDAGWESISTVQTAH